MKIFIIILSDQISSLSGQNSFWKDMLSLHYQVVGSCLLLIKCML